MKKVLGLGLEVGKEYEVGEEKESGGGKRN